MCWLHFLVSLESLRSLSCAVNCSNKSHRRWTKLPGIVVLLYYVDYVEKLSMIFLVWPLCGEIDAYEPKISYDSGWQCLLLIVPPLVLISVVAVVVIRIVVAIVSAGIPRIYKDNDHEFGGYCNHKIRFRWIMKSKLRACVKLWLFKWGIGQYCYVLLPYDWEYQQPFTSDFLG